MLRFSTHESRAANYQRMAREWAHWPIEGKIAAVVIPASLFGLAQGASMVSAVRQAGLEDEVAAGGIIMAILSVGMLELTFGRAARQKLAQSHTPVSRVPLGEQEVPDAVSWASVAPRSDSVLAMLAQVQRHDPGFSEPLLVGTSRGTLHHVATHPAADGELLPFFTRAALRDLRNRLGDARQVLAGPARVLSVEEASAWTAITLSQPFLVQHAEGIRRVPMVWTLRRSTAARSPAPVDRLGFGCPACGSPVEVTHPDGMCTTCDTAITHGQRCWQVADIAGAPSAEALEPHETTGGGEHPSARVQTVEPPTLAADLRGLDARHPEVSIGALEARAGEAALAWFAALAGASPAEHGPLDGEVVAAVAYWRALYESAGLEVRSGPAAVDRIEWAYAGQDGWHERADLRVFLTLPWAILDRDGRTVDGDPDRDRSLSVVVRMAHPSQGSARIEGWRAWQILDPREYAR